MDFTASETGGYRRTRFKVIAKGLFRRRAAWIEPSLVPLTPALSLGEREPRIPPLEKTRRLG